LVQVAVTVVTRGDVWTDQGRRAKFGHVELGNTDHIN